MKPLPEISVVMSVHDNAGTLPAALASILSQEGVDLEFVVIDDGSTDASGQILDEEARRDSRLRVVHQANEGLTCALITGCALASAPWIARQDADDLSLPGRLRAQLDRARQADAPVLVACGAECRTPAHERLFQVVPPADPEGVRAMILESGANPGPHGSLFFSRQAYIAAGGYRQPFYYAQDLDLRVRLAACGAVVSIPEILYVYCFSPVSISGYAADTQAAFRRLILAGRRARESGASESAILAEAESLCLAVRNSRRPVQDPFAGTCFIGACLMRQDPRRAANYFKEALSWRPWSVRARARLAEARFRTAIGNETRGQVPTIPLPLAHPCAYLKFAVVRRVHRQWHLRINHLRRCDIRIAGEYFSGNLGDWTMGNMFLSAAGDCSHRPGLTDYASAGTSPGPLIMGGGELGDALHFTRAFELAGAPERVAACGINPVYNVGGFPQPLLDAIRKTAYLSVRSKSGAALLRNVLARPDVAYHPDPAFCLFTNVPAPLAVASRQPRRMAISLMTFYLSVQRRRVFAADATMKTVVADPEFRQHIETAGEVYIEVMRRTVRQALAQGWEVLNIPFSEVDAMFADAVLGDLNVRRIPYSRDYRGVIAVLQTCRKYLAARFHSHVFGFVAGTPVVSLAYSGKCVELWKDLGLDPGLQVGRIDLCRDPAASSRKLLEVDGVTLPLTTLGSLADAARSGIRNAYAAVMSG